jgi:hypothetical protein
VAFCDVKLKQDLLWREYQGYKRVGFFPISTQILIFSFIEREIITFLLIVLYLWLQQKQQYRLKLRSYVRFCPWCRHTNNVYR